MPTLHLQVTHLVGSDLSAESVRVEAREMKDGYPVKNGNGVSWWTTSEAAPRWGTPIRVEIIPEPT